MSWKRTVRPDARAAPDPAAVEVERAVAWMSMGVVTFTPLPVCDLDAIDLELRIAIDRLGDRCIGMCPVLWSVRDAGRE